VAIRNSFKKKVGCVFEEIWTDLGMGMRNGGGRKAYISFCLLCSSLFSAHQFELNFGYG
jgi:hypothetical protein